MDILHVLVLCLICLFMTVYQFISLKKGKNKNDKSIKKDK